MADLKTVTVNWDDEDRPVITVTYSSEESRPSSGSGMRADADEWLTALADRVSDNGAHFLDAMLDANQHHGFISLANLAKEIDVEKKVVDGWNRNLGRSVKTVVRDLGFLRTDAEDGTAQLFDFKWDEANNLWLYAIPTKYRSTLRQALANA